MDTAIFHSHASCLCTWGRTLPIRLTTAALFPNQRSGSSYRQHWPSGWPELVHRMTPMLKSDPRPILLASGSTVRAALLRNAGVSLQIAAPRIDEASIRAALEADGASPRDIADALAEMKARKVSDRQPDALVIGCDQVLDLDGQILGKPRTDAEARAQIVALRGRTHRLLSAVVVCHGGRPLWRHVGTARLTMREVSDDYLDDYLARNWPDIGNSAGAYKLEAEGVRLFSRIEGEYFTILGLPLIELLTWLSIRGDIAS